jgi:transcriptional regulator with XRE-family HTH domain
MVTEATVIRSARERAGLSQRELAERAGTSQPAVARVESGRGSVTIGTLRRLLAAAGFELVLGAEPAVAGDPVTAAYRRDVDRTLIRESLGRTVDERLRTGAELVTDLEEISKAVRAARRRRSRNQ